MTLADFGCPVYALWFSFRQRLSMYLAFQSIYCEHTWWWLFQKRVYLPWAHLVMVIPETGLFTVSTPGDGYSRNESIYCEHTWWWLFQKRVYLLWAHLVMVITETSLFTVSTPGDGYSRNASQHHFGYLMCVEFFSLIRL